MQLPKLNYKKWTWPPLTLAFCIPFLGMLIVMLYSGYAPFGSSSMFKSDMYHQYYPFFLDFRRMLLKGDSLLYCWDLGMGLDYLGLYAYYLASPLNFLCVLVPESWMMPLFALLQPLKLGLAGLFFAICLKGLFGKNDLSISLFGAFYALCSWALGYMWNIMWLDSFALLPLVVLGTVKLLKDKKFLLYTLSLFFAIAVNYYIGLFVCIFVALSFFCYEICCFKNFKTFFLDLGRIAAFSLIAIGMTAIITLPAYASLQTTYSSVNKFPTDFSLNILDKSYWQDAANAWTAYNAAKETGAANLGQWLDAVGKSILPTLQAMSQVAANRGGGIEPTFVTLGDLPNLYCGVFANVLSFLYLFCRRIKLREKLCAVFLLVFFNLSFVLPQLDYLMHGMHFPNSIPHRYSFLYSFVVLIMAYRAWQHRKSFRALHYVGATAIALIYVVISGKYTAFCNALLGQGNLAETVVFPAFNFLLIAGYVLVLALTHVTQRRPYTRLQRKAHFQNLRMRRAMGSWLFLGVMGAELILNLINFNSYLYPGVSVSSYPKEAASTSQVLQIMKEDEKDSDFYRAEMTHVQILNDSPLNGYSGISAFTSSANVATTNYLRCLGLSARDYWNQYTYRYATPVANLFLNLKYLIERNNIPVENPTLTPIHKEGNVTLLKNDYYLPLGFMVDPAMAQLDLIPQTETNHLDYQERLLEAATGMQLNLWHTVYGDNLKITGNDVTFTKANPQTGFCDYAAPNGGYVNYSYTADKAGLFCVNMHLGKRATVHVYVLKKGDPDWTFLYTEEYKLPQTMSCYYVEPGDKIFIKISTTKGDDSTMLLRGAILNQEAFDNAYKKLSAHTMDITEFSNTRVTGTVSCEKPGLLYTSIPQNGNWNVYVDGQKADVTLIGEGMVGVLLPTGSHQVEFRYENKAFTWGCIISSASLITLVVIHYLNNKPKYYGRYQKKA